MKYNFDKPVDRYGTDCLKWDMLESKYHIDKDGISMWVADMDFESPKEVVEAITKRAQHGVYGYTYKTDEYYQTIIDWYKKHYNFDIPRDRMFYSPGIVPGIDFAVHTYTNENDGVAILTPVYTPFFNVIKNSGRTVKECPLKIVGKHYEIDFEALDKVLSESKMLVFCSPHNPSGRVWTREELEKVAEICKKHDIIVVSDEIHCDLTQKGHTHIPFATISDDMYNRSVTFVSPSKTFNIAGLQASTVIIPNEELFNKYIASMIKYNVGMTNAFAVCGSKAAYKYGAEWLEQVLEYIAGNYKFVKEYIEENIPEIKLFDLEATYLIWLDMRNITTNDEEIAEIFEKRSKIAGEAGTVFGTEGSGFYRLNIATQRSNVEEAMHRLKKAVEEFKNK